MKLKAKKLLSIFLFCALSPVVMAQSNNGTAVAELSVQSQIIHPEYGGYTNILGGTTYDVLYNFSINTDLGPSQKITGISLATYRFGTISGSLDAALSDNEITVSPLQFNSLGEGEYELTYNIIYNFIDTSAQETAQEQTAMINCTSNGKVKVWPSISSSPGETTKKSVISDTQVTLGTLNYNGGNNSGWRIEWSAGSPSADGKTCTYISTTTGSMRNNTVTAVVSNAAPGNTGNWYTETYTYTIPTYVKPNVELIDFPNAVYVGNEITGSAKVSGGNTNGWIYSWTPGNGNSSSFLYTPQTALTQAISLTATNTAPDGVTLYNGQSNTNVIVYEKPSVTLYTPSRTDYINGENFTLTVIPSGGQAGKWTYEWMVDGVKQNDTQASFNFNCINTGSIQRNYNISVNAKNNAEGVASPYTQTLTFTAIVWPSGSVTIEQASTKSIFSGESVTFSVTPHGGFDTGWIYDWQLPSSMTANTTNESKIMATGEAISDNLLNQTLTCNIKNIIDGVEVFSTEVSYYVNIYTNVSVTISNSPSRTNYINGESVTLEAITQGGDSSKWTYNWNLSGGGTNSEKQYNFNAQNTKADGSEAFTADLRATNTPDDLVTAPAIATSQLQFYVWPTPMISSQTQNGAVYSGTPVTLSVQTQGGYAEGWHYQWSGDGISETYDNPNITLYTENSGTQAKIYNVSVLVTNDCEDYQAFNETRNFMITVWPKANVAFSESYQTDIISGQALPMSVTVNGGDPEKWTYAWNVNGGDNGTQKDYTFQQTNLAENGSIVKTVAVTAINTPENIDKPYTTTLTHTINIWAVPMLKEMSEGTQAIYSGTSLPLYVTMQGGYTAGWHYQWQVDNSDVGSDTGNYILSMENSGVGSKTHTVTVKVTNICAGETVFEQTYTFMVIIWPIASAKFASSEYPIDIIAGSSVMMYVDVEGGDNECWTYQWINNGQTVGTGSEYNYIAQNDSNTEPRTEIIKVDVTNIPEYIITPYKIELSHTYTVWPVPNFVAQSDPNPVTCDGRSLKMSVETIGGYKNGWIYEWKLNGNVISDATTNELQQTFTNTDASMRTDVYTVHITNGVSPSEVKFDRTYTFTVSVYPAAKFGVSQSEYDLYYGEIANLEANYSGGYPEGWTFQWDTPNNSTEPNNPIVIPNSQEDNYNLTYTVVITNSYQDEVWYKGTFPVAIEAWSLGEISAVPLDSVDYNMSVFVTLETKQKGGYPGPNGGWKYIWNDNGKSVVGGANYNIAETNYSNEVETLTYFMDATNSLDGRIGTDETFNWTIRVWPEILAPERIDLSATSIRGGETLYVGTYPEAARGGYTPNGIDSDWKYQWTANGVVVSNSSNFITTPTNGTRKGTETIEYELKLQNMGPNGVYWYNNTFKSYVKVYAAPQMPISLVRKGNGTTCTMIAESALNNDQLSDLDYYFVFGYTDSEGRDHSAATLQTNRYDHFEPSIYNNPQNKFWVYTSWSYDDGSIVTSGKRFLNGFDESFDGSVFSNGMGSRGDVSGLETISNENGHLISDGYSFTASLEDAAEAEIKVYDAAGYLVKHLKYPEDTEFNETIDLSRLVNGIYFVEVRVGGEKKTTKIFIKSKG